MLYSAIQTTCFFLHIGYQGKVKHLLVQYPVKSTKNSSWSILICKHKWENKVLAFAFPSISTKQDLYSSETSHTILFEWHNRIKNSQTANGNHIEESNKRVMQGSTCTMLNFKQETSITIKLLCVNNTIADYKICQVHKQMPPPYL